VLDKKTAPVMEPNYGENAPKVTANANPTITNVVSHGRFNTSSIVSSQKLRTTPEPTANPIGAA